MTFREAQQSVKKVVGFAGRTFDAGSQCQVVAINTLSKDLSGQMRLFRNLACISAPFIFSQHVDGKMVSSSCNSRQLN